jgi:hypothetical protein
VKIVREVERGESTQQEENGNTEHVVEKETIMNMRKEEQYVTMNEQTSEAVHVYAAFDFWQWRFLLLFFPLIGVGWMASGVVAFLSYHNLAEFLEIALSGLVYLLWMIAL